jgi:hypothetical protein
MWMRRNYPDIPFERYADDAICHCRGEEQAKELRASIKSRFVECGLTLHPEKTRIVYCKDDDRRDDYPDQTFDFLGYTFRSWSLHERSDKSLDDLARMFNCYIRGWINYYGRFYKSALYPTLRHIDQTLARWAHRKFKSLQRHRRRARHWLDRVARRQPRLFAHWGLLQGRG